MEQLPSPKLASDERPEMFDRALGLYTPRNRYAVDDLPERYSDESLQKWADEVWGTSEQNPTPNSKAALDVDQKLLDAMNEVDFNATHEDLTNAARRWDRDTLEE